MPMIILQYMELIIIVITDIIGLSLASIMAYIGYRLYRFNWNEYAIFSFSWILFALSRFMEAAYLTMLLASFFAGEIYFPDPLSPAFTHWWLTISILDLACFTGILFYQRQSGKSFTVLFLPVIVKIGVDLLTALIIILITVSQLRLGIKAKKIVYVGYGSLALSYFIFGLISMIFVEKLRLLAALLRLIGLLLLFNVVWRVE